MIIEGKLSSPFQLAGRKVWVAGDRGMVGQALVRRLKRENCEILTCTREEVDFRRQSPTEQWVGDRRPDVIFLAAATVGGILANDTRPAEFIYDNLTIKTNIIEAARRSQVAKLMMLGSSCIYPRMAKQPITEDELLAGPLEPTNQWYAMAKVAGIKLGQAYRRQYGFDCISAMPTNLYGPGDNYDLRSSHVVPALLRKIHDAKSQNQESVVIWGTGKPRREFMHVDDCADALVFLVQNYSGEDHVNVGTGIDITIRELAEKIAGVIGYKGAFHYDTSKPDGTPRKLLDVSRLAALGWRAQIGFDDGLRSTYAAYCENAGGRRR